MHFGCCPRMCARFGGLTGNRYNFSSFVQNNSGSSCRLRFRIAFSGGASGMNMRGSRVLSLTISCATVFFRASCHRFVSCALRVEHPRWIIDTQVTSEPKRD
jgi:hypothetical protein